MFANMMQRYFWLSKDKIARLTVADLKNRTKGTTSEGRDKDSPSWTHQGNNTIRHIHKVDRPDTNAAGLPTSKPIDHQPDKEHETMPHMRQLSQQGR